MIFFPMMFPIRHNKQWDYCLCAVLLLRKNDKTFGEDDAANSTDGDDSNNDSNKKYKLII